MASPRFCCEAGERAAPGPCPLHPSADPAPPPERVPQTAFCGFRKWALLPHGLSSSNRGLYTWTIGVNRAQCLSTRAFACALARGPGAVDWIEVSPSAIPPDQGHRAPAHSCGCGLYASYHPWRSLDRYLCQGPPVYGAISAWGRLELHPDGFRAEYARVVALAPGDAEELARWGEDPDEFEARLRALAGEFGVTCTRREELLDVVGEHGELVPRELIPALTEEYAAVIGTNHMARRAYLRDSVRRWRRCGCLQLGLGASNAPALALLGAHPITIAAMVGCLLFALASFRRARGYRRQLGR
jgi:hypothetical protein